jgi:hypothetical protein
MLNRREFLGHGASLCAGVVLRASWLQAATAGGDPHFFLQVFISGGMDSSYLFDARPLAMTQAGKIQNYLGEEPRAWEGKNGQVTLATRLVEKLAPYRARFSVINGIVMTTTFDGHPQNINYMFSGNPFGGDSFIPDLNQGGDSLSLDAIQEGQLPGSFRNLGKSVPMSAVSGARLIEKNRTVPQLDPTNPAIAFIRTRMEANGRGPGGFSAASKLMAQAYGESPRLSTQLAGIQMSFTAKEDDGEGRFLELMTAFFKHGISRSAVIAFDTRLAVDTHDAASASRQPQTYEMITSRLARIFKFLEDTEFLPGRSLWEFTTVSVASEFGRTMRQGGKRLDQTGTDHNPLANSILLGGKGIRGNLLIGATDFVSASDTVSPAHAYLDPLGMKAMARPFDFDRFVPRTDLPAEYTDTDYISIQSVVNSIYSVFGVNRSRHWKVGRNGPVAKVLTPLLI